MEKFKPYNPNKAQLEAKKMRRKIDDGDAQDYNEAEKKVEKESLIKLSQKIVGDFKKKGIDINESTVRDNFLYFSAVDHYIVASNFVDFGLIEKMKRGGRLLSVGVGPCCLERFIHEGFKIPAENIVISDIELSKEAQESDLPMVEFDMTKKWPGFDKKFDYILFPESFGVSDWQGSKEYHPKDFFSEYAYKFARKVWEENEIDEEAKKLAIEVIEEKNSVIKEKYSTIKQALENLNDEGELRFDGHCMSIQELAYISLKLREELPHVEIKREYQYTLVIVKHKKS